MVSKKREDEDRGTGELVGEGRPVEGGLAHVPVHLLGSEAGDAGPQHCHVVPHEEHPQPLA